MQEDLALLHQEQEEAIVYLEDLQLQQAEVVAEEVTTLLILCNLHLMQVDLEWL
tara:strand:+ start:310 stop:471 length:162 start_codon:yes stop_codon:yes gene_type:complete